MNQNHLSFNKRSDLNMYTAKISSKTMQQIVMYSSKTKYGDQSVILRRSYYETRKNRFELYAY
jgi:hypothetical protein